VFASVVGWRSGVWEAGMTHSIARWVAWALALGVSATQSDCRSGVSRDRELRNATRVSSQPRPSIA